MKEAMAALKEMGAIRGENTHGEAEEQAEEAVEDGREQLVKGEGEQETVGEEETHNAHAAATTGPRLRTEKADTVAYNDKIPLEDAGDIPMVGATAEVELKTPASGKEKEDKVTAAPGETDFTENKGLAPLTASVTRTANDSGHLWTGVDKLPVADEGIPLQDAPVPGTSEQLNASIPFEKRHHVIFGYNATLTYLQLYTKSVDSKEELFLFFTCSESKGGRDDWNPNCATAREKVYATFAKSPSTNRLVTIHAGPREDWMGGNAFTDDDDLRLKAVPTLMRWDGGALGALRSTWGVLVDNSILYEPLVRYLFRNADEQDKLLAKPEVETKEILTLRGYAQYRAYMESYAGNGTAYPLFMMMPATEAVKEQQNLRVVDPSLSTPGAVIVSTPEPSATHAAAPITAFGAPAIPIATGQAASALADRHDIVSGYAAAMRYLANYRVPEVCVDASKLVYDVFAKSPARNRLLTIHAGSKQDWSAANAFFKDGDLKVKMIPALMQWHGGRPGAKRATSGMIIEESILYEPLLRYLFKNQDVPDPLLAPEKIASKEIVVLKGYKNYRLYIDGIAAGENPSLTASIGPMFLFLIAGRLGNNDRLWCPYCRYSEISVEYAFYAFAPPGSRLVKVETRTNPWYLLAGGFFVVYFIFLVRWRFGNVSNLEGSAPTEQLSNLRKASNPVHVQSDDALDVEIAARLEEQRRIEERARQIPIKVVLPTTSPPTEPPVATTAATMTEKPRDLEKMAAGQELEGRVPGMPVQVVEETPVVQVTEAPLAPVEPVVAPGTVATKAVPVQADQQRRCDEQFKASDWSEECVKGKQHVYDVFSKSPGRNRLVTVFAGSEKYWKHQNEFYNDPDLRVKGVPCIMQWEGRSAGASLCCEDVKNKQIVTVNGYDAYVDAMVKFEKEENPSPTFLMMVSGRFRNNNRPWCPYCRYSELPLEYAFYSYAPKNARLIRVEVTDSYAEWRKRTEFTADQNLQLKIVPLMFKIDQLPATTPNGPKSIKFTQHKIRYDQLAPLRELFTSYA
ncbi:Thioredoxin-like fold [Phytophthora cactorum]|nr:Thioredoxin-like fold [Phytophthora cactorum]